MAKIIDDYVPHHYLPVTGVGAVPANTTNYFVPVTGKEEFEDYVTPPHPEGYKSGGVC